MFNRRFGCHLRRMAGKANNKAEKPSAALKRKNPDTEGTRKATGAGEKREVKVPKSASAAASSGQTLDDIFGSATIKGKSGACKSGAGKAAHAKPGAADGGIAAKPISTGPDMEQVKKEAAKFLSAGKGQRCVVDGVKVYSEAELDKEMGEDAWQAFEEAADESLAKGLSSKDYW